jgi:hypothetical protein
MNKLPACVALRVDSGNPDIRASPRSGGAPDPQGRVAVAPDGEIRADERTQGALSGGDHLHPLLPVHRIAGGRDPGELLRDETPGGSGVASDLRVTQQAVDRCDLRDDVVAHPLGLGCFTGGGLGAADHRSAAEHRKQKARALAHEILREGVVAGSTATDRLCGGRIASTAERPKCY